MLRKNFIKISAAAFAGTIAAPLLKAVPANGKSRVPAKTVNLAVFGLGGMGLADMAALAAIPGVRITALCDCDERAIKRALARLEEITGVPAENVETFVDFRDVFTKSKNPADAAVVAVPDHSHFSVAMEAVKHGKHLFVEKPICKKIDELRSLTAAANAKNLITQAGNQGAVSNLIRTAKEWIEAGVLGEITRIHAWTNRPVWPQGMRREPEPDPCPEKLHWDLWLNGAFPRKYSKAVAPFNWRGWIDYGTGALGDMAQHVLNPAFFTLDLGVPEKIDVREIRGNSNIAFPTGEKIVFHFKTKNQKPLEITWFDGCFTGTDFQIPEEAAGKIGGSVFFGTENSLLVGPSGEFIRLLRPFDKNKLKNIKQKYPRTKGNIYRNWIDALQGKTAGTLANFNAMLPLTETVLMGVEAQLAAGKTVPGN